MLIERRLRRVVRDEAATTATEVIVGEFRLSCIYRLVVLITTSRTLLTIDSTLTAVRWP